MSAVLFVVPSMPGAGGRVGGVMHLGGRGERRGL